MTVQDTRRRTGDRHTDRNPKKRMRDEIIQLKRDLESEKKKQVDVENKILQARQIVTQLMNYEVEKVNQKLAQATAWHEAAIQERNVLNQRLDEVNTECVMCLIWGSRTSNSQGVLVVILF